MIMIDLVCGEVHSVPTGVAGRHTKEGWQRLGNYYCACIVRKGVQICVKHVPLKFLWLPKHVRTLKYSYLQALLVKHASYRYMVKLFKLFNYLKANRRFHGALHPLPKPPPSVDCGHWLTAG